MKTLIRSFAVAVVLSTLTFQMADAQVANAINKTPKPELKTLKAYNAYVKTIDLTKASAADKAWLEHKYNSLVDAMDQKYHNKSKEDLCVNNKTQPAFSYVDVPTAKSSEIQGKK